MKVTITYTKIISKIVEVPDKFRAIPPDEPNLSYKEEKLLDQLTNLCDSIAASDDGELCAIMDETEEKWYAEF